MKSILSHKYITRLGALARHFALLVAVAALATACADDDFGAGSEGEGGYITLRLSNVSGAARATGYLIEGDDDLNERLIESATVCLFPQSARSDTDRPEFMVTYSVNVNKETEIKIGMNNTLKDKLFPSGVKTAYCYVIANLPSTTTVPATPTLRELKELTVTADFATTKKQPSFVMDGDAVITLGTDATTNSEKVTGEVPLKRAAAKISLAIKLVESVTEGDRTWVPMTENMYTLISNGVKKTTVDPSLYAVTTDDYFRTTTNADDPTQRQRMLSKSSDATAEFPYVLTQPYYSYPNTWTAEDDNATMTYITLMVPWKDQDDNYRRCYYMVPLVKDESELKRNYFYKVKVKVNILGSFSPEEPTLIIDDCSYRAIDWGSAPVNVEIDEYRYLVVNQSNYTMNNTATLNVPFYSSHPTEVTDIKVKYFLYNTDKYGNEKEVPITTAQNEKSTSTLDGKTIHIYDATVDNNINDVTGARTMVFDHPLYQWTPYTANNTPIQLTGKLVANGNIIDSSYPTTQLSTLLDQIDHYVRTSNEAYSRYEVEITIAHSDRKTDPLYQKTIHIVQYPGMNISAKYNAGDTNKYWAYIGVEKDTRFTSDYHKITDDDMTEDNYGYVFVNALYLKADSYKYNGKTYNRRAFWLMNSLGRIDPISNTSNNGNRNNYVISISQLSTDKYKIGDPRSSNINNDLSGNKRLDGSASTADASSWCNAARYLDDDGNVTASGTTRKLKYYHPTLETDATKNMIAPQFRIASSYGEMMATSWENCRRRCATYQERGYPAGRWRMPTRAEVEYIATLANDGKIPKLFIVGKSGNKRGVYMTAQGPYQILMGGSLSENNVTNSSYLVRCVYDEWYWGSEAAVPGGSYEGGLKYTYVLGDRKNF